MVSLDEYLLESEYPLEEVWCDCLHGRYKGRGILTWNHQHGFHVEAPVDREGPPFRYAAVAGPRVILNKDLCSIRMTQMGTNDRIFAFKILDREPLSVALQGRLSLSIPRVLFIKKKPTLRVTGGGWCGMALLRIGDTKILSDIVSEEIILCGEILNSSHSRSGIACSIPNGGSIKGVISNKEYLRLQFDLPKGDYSHINAWRWPESLAIALSILLGKTVRLLCSDILIKERQCVEVRKQENVEEIAIFKPFESPTSLSSQTFRDLLTRLAFFISNKSIESMVCRNIFFQIVESARQETWQATELLMATILEAALRTLFKKPYIPGDRTFNRKLTMQEFRQKYLSDDWEEACDMMLKKFNEVRHRNAHPDWLYSETGSTLKPAKTEVVNDLCFMSRFYGYMILAISGVRNIQPIFP